MAGICGKLRFPFAVTNSALFNPPVAKNVLHLEGRYDERGQPATPYIMYGQPAFSQNTLNVKCTVMCIIIKSCRFAGFFSISAFHFMQRLG